ncbi:MAG: hypothetical protein Kow0090_19890 [Myxococcota bacterium]
MIWNPLKRSDYLISAAIIAVTVCVLLATVRGVGFVRDEGYYFKAARLYQGWFSELFDSFASGDFSRPFKKEVIDKHFGYNREHPVFAKEIFALSDSIFDDGLGVMRESTAMRLPGMLWAALCLALLYLFGAHIHSRLAGILAALILIAHPRFFHHSHLACFDVPITAMILFTTYAYFRGFASKKWAIFTGVIWGFAIATKHNALFLPPLFFLHWFCVSWKEFRFVKNGSLALNIPKIPAQFVSMAIFGPLIFLAHWPLLWHDTINRLGWYFRFHLNHEHYPIAYLHKIYELPPFPWEFPIVMTLFTVPSAFLVLFAFGAVRSFFLLFIASARSLVGLNPAPPVAKPPDSSEPPHIYDGRGSLELLILICIALPIFLIALPNTPIFGGVKHWFPALPFIALLAARELANAGKCLWGEKGGILRRAAAIALLLLIFLPALLGIIRHHPYGITYYNYFAGGIRGAADMEMMRNFWGYEVIGALDYINRNGGKGARIFFQRTNYDSMKQYQKEGLLRSDFQYANTPDSAQIATFHYKNPFIPDEMDIWSEFKTQKPVMGIYIDEVPIHRVYFRERDKKARSRYER